MKPIIFAISLALIIFGRSIAHATPAQPKQLTFDNPQSAVSALTTAVVAEDWKMLALIFGPGSQQLLSSGDTVSDQIGLKTFSEMLSQLTSLEKAGESQYILIAGNQNWPFPIPLVSEGQKWHFDTKAGADEILNRRIGRNELWAIEMAHNYVAAQKSYFSRDQDGDGYREYAQVMISNRGWHNGLFWVRGPGQAASPLGPVVAQAFAEGYRASASGERVPVHGYYFKILSAQGADAAGGKKNYITSGGMMTEGFALIAYPAQWGNSGVMTFVVNQDGQVYQKNLGPKSQMIAEKITAYNPDKSWNAAP